MLLINNLINTVNIPNTWKEIISKFKEKLFFKKWIIGICSSYSIENIIRSKVFDPEIDWKRIKSNEKFYADPFPFISEKGYLKILYEDFTFKENYGKICLLTYDKKHNQVSDKVLLNTKSHLSYPLIFKEDGRFFVFPEASKSGKLSCYEYDPVNESLHFLQDVIYRPLLDATVIKVNSRYWIFGCLSQHKKDISLHVFFADKLLGPYKEHPQNPVKAGLDGTRSAGNFIEVDGNIYRPAQNCKRVYGESITINKVTELTEYNIAEEAYMDICINKKRKCNYGLQTIHTINIAGDVITVDGDYWTFSPLQQIKKFTGSIIKRNRQLA